MTNTDQSQIREMKENAAVTVQEAAAKERASAPAPPVEMIKEPRSQGDDQSEASIEVT